MQAGLEVSKAAFAQYMCCTCITGVMVYWDFIVGEKHDRSVIHHHIDLKRQQSSNKKAPPSSTQIAMIWLQLAQTLNPIVCRSLC